MCAIGAAMFALIDAAQDAAKHTERTKNIAVIFMILLDDWTDWKLTDVIVAELLCANQSVSLNRAESLA